MNTQPLVDLDIVAVAQGDNAYFDTAATNSEIDDVMARELTHGLPDLRPVQMEGWAHEAYLDIYGALEEMMARSGNVRIPIVMADLDVAAWIEVSERRPGIFFIEADNISGDFNELALANFNVNSEVDVVSDELSIWRDVWLTPHWFRAPTVERLIEALQQVSWSSKMLSGY